MKTKQAKISDIVTELQKVYGRHAAVLLRDEGFLSNAPYGISTQSLSIDLSIGRPGLPAGRIIEITGIEGSGKSTLGEHIMAEFQRIGGLVCVIETEHGRDLARMKKIGIDESQLMVLQPETLEQGFSMIQDVIKTFRKRDTKSPFLILWDSIAATQTKDESKIKYDDSTMALHARIISQAMRKLLPLIAQKRVTAIFINQLKENIQQFGFGDKWRPFGGKSIQYSASVSLRVSKIGEVTTGSKRIPVAFKCQTQTKKNRVGTPKIKANVEIAYATGIIFEKDLLQTALEYKLIKSPKKGIYVFKNFEFDTAAWSQIVQDCGGPHVMREMLTNRALKKSIILPYGNS